MRYRKIDQEVRLARNLAAAFATTHENIGLDYARKKYAHEPLVRLLGCPGQDNNRRFDNASWTASTWAEICSKGLAKQLWIRGLVKSFFIHERHRVPFRAESFNAFNRVNLDSPNANLAAATVGRITSDGAPRVFQLALRYQF